MLPKFFVVSNELPVGYPVDSNNALRRMMWIYIQPTTTPHDAAVQAANAYIENGLTPEDCAITFNGIARDYGDIDFKFIDGTGLHEPGPWFPTAADPHRNDTCFFRLSRLGGSPLVDTDRLPYFVRTGMTSTVAQMPTFSALDHDSYFNFVSRSDLRTLYDVAQPPDRSYRHPFLINAIRSDAALRVWFQGFITEYTALGMPVPTRVFFDVEPSISGLGSVTEVFDGVTRYSAHAVHILHQIYESRHCTDPAYNYWSGIDLPGDPIAGYKLNDRYMADAQQFGLPVINDAQGNPIAPDMDHDTLGLQVTAFLPNTAPIFSGASARNRKFMSWWAEVCNRASEKVMDNCFYSVIRTAWPTANTKYGNYSSIHQDGQLAPMGIIYDSTCGAPGSPCATEATAFPRSNDFNSIRRYATDACSASDPLQRPSERPYPFTHAFTSMTPRCSRFADADGGMFWHLVVDGNGDFPSEKRWGSLVQTSKGNVDSPVLYPFGARLFQYNRIRQPNPYLQLVTSTTCTTQQQVVTNLLESVMEANIRQMRWDVETALGGYRFNSGRPLVPWVVMAGFEYDDGSFDPPRRFTVTIPDYARVQAMLRAKRIEEQIIWTKTKGNIYPDNGQPRYANPAAVAEWNHTETTIRNVYAPAIASAVTYAANSTNPLSTCNTATCLAALEDTLRDASDQPRTWNVEFSPTGVRQVDIHFRNQLTNASNLDAFVLDPDGYDAVVNLEATFTQVGSSVPDNGVDVEVWCKRVGTSDYERLPAPEGQLAWQSNRNDFAALRGEWSVPNRHPLGGPVLDFADIRIVAYGSPTHAFTMKIDLVQVVPFRCLRAKIEPTNCSPVLTRPSPSTAPNAFACTVDRTKFATPGGFEVRWNSEIFEDLTSRPRPSSQPRDYFAYLYAGNSISGPLVNMTCRTQQWTEKGLDADEYVLHIQFSPVYGQVSNIPYGTYIISTRALASPVQRGCERTAVASLRTKKLDFPSVGEPEVENEYIVVTVPGPSVTPLNPEPDDTCTRSTQCPADVDDGSGTGHPDGGVGIEDLLFYLIEYDAGVVCADVDDGSGTGTRDGGVGIEDLLYYLARYDAGC